MAARMAAAAAERDARTQHPGGGERSHVICSAPCAWECSVWILESPVARCCQIALPLAAVHAMPAAAVVRKIIV